MNRRQIKEHSGFIFFFSPSACMNVWKYFVRLFHFASVYNYCLHDSSLLMKRRKNLTLGSWAQVNALWFVLLLD